ncbi:hypothetical protein CspHIS471_0300790 [Cutaneotrichosporon sp. HIS471]|nr:hypothetical protein CspHIS471_0300790 [Cutaneotrichosporon sp. HIS471]
MLARARLRLASRVQRPAVSTVRLSLRFNSTASSSGSSSSSSWSFKPHHAILGGLTLGAILYATLTQETQLDAPKERPITYAEVQKHNSQDDCWVVIGDKVYDLTKFAHIHPGGSTPIHKVAGRDATVIFTPIHSPGIIEDRLDPSALVGSIDKATLPPRPVIPETRSDKDQIPLDEIIGLPDLHEAAKRNMSSKAWSYISSGATDEHSLDLNRRMWNWILFRPRVLVDVGQVDTRTSIMGCETSLPIFIAPTGMSKLAGIEGEPGLAAAAGECDIVQMISTNASASLEATVNAAGAPQIMQLYVDKQRSNSEALLHKVTSLGLKGVVVTVDCASPGKREADERNRATVEASSGLAGGVAGRDKKGGGVGRTTGAYIDPRLKWEDLAWIRQHTFLPIGVKGIQCVEDAEGVVHAIDIMRDEIEVTMKLLGVTRLDQLGPHLLNTKALDHMVIDKLDYGPKEGYVK